MANASQNISDFMGDHLSVSMFGAVCDGVTDDTAAITAAIASAVTYSRPKILIPGMCAISSTITIPAGVCLSGLIMKEGVSPLPPCGLVKIADVVAVKIQGQDVVLSNLAIVGKASGDTTDGVWVGDSTHDASNAHLERVCVSSCGGNGFLLGQGDGVYWDVLALANGADGVYLGDLAGTGNSNQGRGRITAVANIKWGVEIQGSSGNELNIDAEGNGSGNVFGGGILCNWPYNNLTVYTEGNGLLTAVNISAITQAAQAQVTTSTYHGLQTGRSIAFSGTVGGMTQIRFQHGQVTVVGAPITAITQANPAAVTTQFPHGFTTGDTVGFTSDILGMTQIRGLTGTVTVVDTTHFTVNIDSSAFSAYTSGGWVSEAFTFTVNINSTSYTAYTSGGTIQEQTGVYMGVSGFGSTLRGTMNEGPPVVQNRSILIWDAIRQELTYPSTGAVSGSSLDLNNGSGPTQLTIEQSSLQGSSNLLQLSDTTGNALWKVLNDGSQYFYKTVTAWRYNTGKFIQMAYDPTHEYGYLDAFDTGASVARPIVIRCSRILAINDTDDGSTNVQINGTLKVTGKAVIQIAPTISNLSIFANNAAAITGGLSVGDLYRTGLDPDQVCVVH